MLDPESLALLEEFRTWWAVVFKSQIGRNRLRIEMAAAAGQYSALSAWEGSNFRHSILLRDLNIRYAQAIASATPLEIRIQAFRFLQFEVRRAISFERSLEDSWEQDRRLPFPWIFFGHDKLRRLEAGLAEFVF